MESVPSFIIVYMNRLLLALGILFFCSCKNTPEENLSDIIKSDCFWDITEDNQVIGGLNSCYKFLPNGECFLYNYKFYNRKITDSVYRYETDDVIVPTSWSVQGDTLLIARAVHYKVLAFAKSSISVEGFNNDTLVFRKNCSTRLGK